MKRFLPWLAVVSFMAFFLTSPVKAQFGPKSVFKIGYNWSVLSGESVSDVEAWKAVTGGFGLELDLMIVSLQIDLMYSPRGGEIPDLGKVRLHYLSVPIVVKKKFFPVGIHPYIVGGLEFSYLISAKQDGENIRDDLRSDDLGLVAGAGLEFSLLGKGAFLEGRYFYGLGRINQEDLFVDVRNSTYQFTIGLIF